MNLEQHIFKSDSFQELIEEAVIFLLATPIEHLPLDSRFIGTGVYAIYYQGAFPAYSAIYQSNPNLPIYVGKAVPTGWRQGRAKRIVNDFALYRRLREHSRSIDSSSNLELSDFSCRFMILVGDEADLIGIVEAALIRKYNPLWNSYIDGFGNHDPGSGRYNQAKSEWDVLHPGRGWADKLRGNAPTTAEVTEKVKRYKING